MSEEKREGKLEKLIFVGYTNGHQILYGAEDVGSFYSNTDNDCFIPLYMMERHAHRLQNTSGMNVTLEKVLAAQSKGN